MNDEPLFVELPIAKILVHVGHPDTIIIQTNLPSTHTNNPNPPTLVTHCEAGKGEEYVKKVLEIPDRYIQIISQSGSVTSDQDGPTDLPHLTG
jgi:hypothetical protein